MEEDIKHHGIEAELLMGNMNIMMGLNIMHRTGIIVKYLIGDFIRKLKKD